MCVYIYLFIYLEYCEWKQLDLIGLSATKCDSFHAATVKTLGK